MNQANAERAMAAYAAMQRYFQVRDGTGLYRQTYPWVGGAAYAYVWEFSRALVGTLALAGVPRKLVDGTDYAKAVRERFDALEYYWNGRARPPAYDSAVVAWGGGDRYYDDNAWLALALVQRYRMGLTTSLDRARQLFTFAQSGWDAKAGGVYWVQQGVGLGRTNHDRGFGATVGNAQLGYHLQLLTGAALELAPDTMLEWAGGLAQERERGLYQNLVRGDGSIDTNLWSYNQGVMIGARVLQYQLTSKSRFLELAAEVATGSLDAFGDFRGQPPSFNAMLFQNLLMLHPYASGELQTSMREQMQAYADWAWDTARSPSKDDLFYFDDAGRSVLGTGLPAQLRDQGAMVQLFALLAWPPESYPNLT